jgi:hypothetical protein
MDITTITAIQFALLGMLAGAAFAVLAMLLTGATLRIELVLPAMNLQLAPVQVTMERPGGHIVSKLIRGVPENEIARFSRGYAASGWKVTDKKWSGNGEWDIVLSRYEEE